MPDLTPARDALGTLRFRGIFERKMASRFRKMERLLKRSIVTNDAFGLRPARLRTSLDADPPKAARRKAWGGDLRATEQRFIGWYHQTWINLIIETEHPAERPAGEEVYWSKALERAFIAGKKWGERFARQRPVRAEEFSATLTPEEKREFIELRAAVLLLLLGSVDTTEDRLRVILRREFAKRSTPEEIAAVFVREHKVAQARALRIARTETTTMHAQATLNALASFGFQQVTAEVEFTLNVHGNAEPCPVCIALSGLKFKIREARGIIPVHPSCQCGWVPVTP